MAFSFTGKISKKGNIKVSPQALEIIGAESGDQVFVSLSLPAEGYVINPCGRCNECLRIPAELMEEAEIPIDAKLEIFADEGRIIIQEADGDE